MRVSDVDKYNVNTSVRIRDFHFNFCVESLHGEIRP
jgi:hypothetical protein